jgi:hypothetical protein
MTVKIFAAIVALILMLGFLLPPLVKLKDVGLGTVILVGLGLMAVDLWQSLKAKED